MNKCPKIPLYLILWGITLLCSPVLRVNAQSRIVSGKVADAKGKLAGVMVLIPGTSKGTTTNADGQYSISISDENTTLQFSLVGYLPKEVEVGNNSNIDVVMVPVLKQTDELVEVGYGTVQKKDITGAFGQLKMEDLSPTLTTSVDNILGGRMAGLNVFRDSGEPGRASTITIRGITSFIGENDPLLVVDGVPLGEARLLNQINPQDIESINVLKDASLSAIYGSRGSNGVIIVTTKKGTAGKAKIESSYQGSVAFLPGPLNIISDPYLYAQLSNESAENWGQEKLYMGKVNPRDGIYYPSLTEIESGSWPHRTYWPDLVYQNAISHNATVSARGGNNTSTYYISTSYLNQEGIAIGADFDRFTSNLSLETKILPNVKTGLTSNIAFIDQLNPNTEGTVGRNPVFPAKDPSGNYFQVGAWDFGNPLAIREHIRDKKESFNLFGSVYVDWEIFQGFTFSSAARTTFGQRTSDYYESGSYGYRGTTENGYESVNTNIRTKWIYDNYFTYKKTFKTKHHLHLTGGISFEQFSAKEKAFISTEFHNGIATQVKPTADQLRRSNLTSLLGRLNYHFDDKYLLSLTTRTDKPHLLGLPSYYHLYPSVAAGWNLHNESFFPENNFVSTIKIRSSYGVTGEPGSYFNAGYDMEATLLSPIKGEKSRQFNAGLDLAFGDKRLMVQLDYYRNYSMNLLQYLPMPSNTGFSRQLINRGEVSNKGVEISLDALLLERKNFSWRFGANISHNRNEVLPLEQQPVPAGDHQPTIIGFTGQEIERFRAFSNSLAVGYPVNVFYGYQTDGIVQSAAEGQQAGLEGDWALPGEIKYVDLDANGELNDLDRTIIGDPNPLFCYGFHSSLKWKGFDFSLFFRGSYGHDILNLARLDQGSRQLQRWNPDNATNEFPRLRNGRSTPLSGIFIEDGSYLKLQNASLGYHIPLKGAGFVKGLNINLNVENVFTWTEFSGYDPEVSLRGIYEGSAYLKPIIFTAGFRLTL